MSAPGLVPFADALAAISAQREAMEALQAQSLRPLGLGNDPKEWHSTVHAAMTAMNRDYRRQAKVAIVENGQRIRKMIGTDALIVSVLEVVKMYTKAEKMHERVILLQFKTFYAAQKERLTPGESIWYQEGLGSLESSMKAFEDMLADTRKRLVTFTAAF
ncbi:hypothetical protein BV20DRAFT_979309, partial [Pilatotrama ljubarskyi]